EPENLAEHHLLVLPTPARIVGQAAVSDPPEQKALLVAHEAAAIVIAAVLLVLEENLLVRELAIFVLEPRQPDEEITLTRAAVVNDERLMLALCELRVKDEVQEAFLDGHLLVVAGRDGS